MDGQLWRDDSTIPFWDLYAWWFYALGLARRATCPFAALLGWRGEPKASHRALHCRLPRALRALARVVVVFDAVVKPPHPLHVAPRPPIGLILPDVQIQGSSHAHAPPHLK